MDTSKIVKADEAGCIEGLYGNKLKINPDWSNPSGVLRSPTHCSKPVLRLQKLTGALPDDITPC